MNRQQRIRCHFLPDGNLRFYQERPDKSGISELRNYRVDVVYASQTIICGNILNMLYVQDE